jgi:Flp pilus assembly protein TadG
MPIRRFGNDRNGNIVPLFAVAVIPIIGLVGAAVDYSRASAIRSEMQAGLDATALMLSKEASGLTKEQLEEKATAYFKATFNRPEAKGVVITPTLTTKDGRSTIRVVSTGSVDTTFSRLLGHSNIDLGSGSEVTWGVKKLELALALDNTGSMAWSNKMTELKKAAKALLDTLQKAAQKDGDVKVAIIPFNTDVNVGTGKVKAKWIDWADWDANNGTCSNPDYTTKSTCLSHLKTWTPHDHSKWNGCVADRDKNILLVTTDYDVNDTAPDPGLKKALFPAHQADPCPVKMLPLTSQWSTLHSKIDEMTPVGTTNVTIGLAWGWHALTKGAPLPEAAAPAADLDKVLILLTDGQNTQNRWSTNQAEIDERTKKACENIKKDTVNNIKVYTVRVIEGNVPLLQSCASKPDMFYDVQNAPQLNTVFKQISENLASLRISK